METLQQKIDIICPHHLSGFHPDCVYCGIKDHCSRSVQDLREQVEALKSMTMNNNTITSLNTVLAMIGDKQ